ncbi:valine--tRNA ligase [Candidatus Woesebacteria bacterium GWA1_42_12]|uniref:Valine--tRNA ligase n=1 Tax=Candidatus Woesebacteria bacterium GWA1_42_12 TaxID=1802472 RepID=A0A1F7WLF1_9BACT|nr:MAG: valine--tRNA ligase [Candidatus Woesebacteria bacterium GWA1_42_12]
MDKVYDHTKFEAETYRLWEKSGAFTARVDKKKKPFTIIMPPPNASDPLHIGHAREVATQDILTRYHRMKGESSLWLPGADHAGIETQFIFEKKLQKEGKSRFDFDRETLFKMIWDYVQENKSVMEAQLKTLGASCDWTRYKFTLDPDIVKIVYKTFKRLYADGLIYRGERIVNYCPRCGTAFSQLEVDSVERVDPLYYLDYGEVSIATTRPETIFADVAIAVNPDDVRYKHLIGKTATLPLIGRKLPIIADSLVDKDFGTGALKITPGHDATDFEIGQKHNLSALYVIDSVGRMVNTPAKYIGLKALDARNLVVEDLRAKGLIKKVQNIKHVVGVCYRDKGLIEPTISKQWFVKVSPLTKPALKAIREGQVSFAAKKYEKIAIHWLKNLKDWNISRQIVWGIRIPAWRCDKCLEWTITEGTPPEKCEACSHAGLTQDPDTFDTWFSSGQWPFATLQTTKHEDFEYFYPTSVMNPAYDILPFWVIRMVMLGLYVTGEPPFKEVLLHGLVRDKFGVKISKSKGNIINPIEMVQKYGADALRVALIWGSLVENDNSVSEENIKGQRNFANKIWNVSRFVLMSPQAKKAKRNEDDLEIIKHLKFTSKRVTKLLEKYRLNEAAEELYDFVWHKFADVYIEKTKGRREEAQKTLELVLQESLKLLHPFMPFVTEVIWQEGAKRFDSPTLISAPWPKS